MYGDHSPVPQLKTGHVIVVEETDTPFGSDFADELIGMAFEWNAVTGSDEDPTFWVVYANEPRRVWDFTERALRSTFRAKTMTGV